MESVTTINGVDHQIESSNNTPTTNHIDEPSTDDICPCDNHENSSTTKLDNDKELILKLDNLLLDDENDREIYYHSYQSEKEMSSIMSLISGTLSEPYSIYTYRYFIHNWPDLCFLCSNKKTNELIGAIVSKLDLHKKILRRGYIAMLAINKEYRRKKIASKLVLMSIKEMIKRGCDEIVLEAEVTNDAALNLYEHLGFLREKRLYRYYLNGVDAYRLKLWLK
jgi:peptide alpha-N-acetyltransferase